VKFPVLVSYAYARKDEESFAKLLSSPHIDLLLDCGAFTAKNAGEVIRLDDYCQFLDKWGGKIFRYLALDVVGNPGATDANLRQMLKSGYSPVPVHVLGDDQRRMDELFEYSDYVALAGLRRPHKGGAPKEYVAAKMKWAAGRDVHWLGYVREPMIAAFKPYSCDSASWASAQMYGTLSVYLGKGEWVSCVYASREKVAKNPRAIKQLAKFGYTMAHFNDPLCWRPASSKGYPPETELSNVVTSDSWVRYVIDIQRRYKTRVFLAARGGGRREEVSIFAAIDRHADKLYLDPLPV
jgi:hypothetical protein